MKLPPGQRAVQGFPRFGTDLAHPPPATPTGMAIEIAGELTRHVSFAPVELRDMPRREVWPTCTAWLAGRPSD